MFQALINLFKPHKPTPAPVEVKVEDTIKVEEPVAVVPEPALVIEEPTPASHQIPLPQTVSQNVAQWPFPNQQPAEKVKASPVKKPAKPTSTTKAISKPAPKPVRKSK